MAEFLRDACGGKPRGTHTGNEVEQLGSEIGELGGSGRRSRGTENHRGAVPPAR
jgi:hypothetical protein